MYRLLIVDDEKIECEGLRMLIEYGGFPFQVDTALNAEDAYDLFCKKPYDLLITDIQMGEISGLVLCEKAKERDPDLITVIISAYGEFDYAKEAIRLRVDDYLLKPISPEKFNSTIQSICDELDCRRKKKQLVQMYAKADLPQKEQILDELFELAHSESNSHEPPSGVVHRVIQLVEKNYGNDISLEWLASEVYLTPGYLSQYFKQETGQSLIQYLTDYRMEIARDLLLNTNMKISDVGKKVGYKNNSYFCALFKKHFGCTAVDVRKNR